MDTLIGRNDLVDFDQKSLAGIKPQTPKLHKVADESLPVAAAAIAFNPIFWK
jgi:hypothetical protein